MSNPGVIILAEIVTSIGDFRIEDNIGESIHLHLGDFRYDLTICQFNDLYDDIYEIFKIIMNDIPGFILSQFSSEFLLQKAGYLPDLLEVKKDEIYLENLIVDTVGLFGLSTFKTLTKSRVLKALNGNTKENDLHQECNYYGQTNQQRVEKMLESIKLNGYPQNNQYIVLFNHKNNIQDGQHRAACLYYLGGNQRIPVLRMCFRNNKYSDFSYPLISRIFCWNKYRIKSLLKREYGFLKQTYYKTKEKIIEILTHIDRFYYLRTINKEELDCEEIAVNINYFFEELNKADIDYVLIKNIGNELPEHLKISKDIDILVNEEDKVKFHELMKKLGRKVQHPYGPENGWINLYDLPQFEMWRLFNGIDLRVDVTYRLCCMSLMDKTWIPLDNIIQTYIWNNRLYNYENGWWEMDINTRYIYYIVRCIFDKKQFSEKYIKEIDNIRLKINKNATKNMLELIFFGFTTTLIRMLKNKDYDNIRNEYIRYIEY